MYETYEVGLTLHNFLFNYTSTFTNMNGPWTNLNRTNWSLVKIQIPETLYTVTL